MNKNLTIALLLVLAVFHNTSLMASGSVTHQDVVRHYLEDRASAVNSSLGTSDPEFKSLLLSEQKLLNKLATPGHESALLLLVLHEKLSSINALKNTIAETRAKPHELSDYFIQRYQADLDHLRLEAAVLEKAVDESAGQ